MVSVLRKINRPLTLEDKVINIEDLINQVAEGQHIKVVLNAVHQNREVEHLPIPDPEPVAPTYKIGATYKIKVRQYMTKPSSPEFDFQDKFNKGIPMPFRIMVGKILKETRGMVQAECHVEAMQTAVCMRCGRRLTHPISKLYGIGPECGSHAYINPFNSEEELNENLEQLKSNLARITWNGWIIKSSIEEMEEIDNGRAKN